MVNKEVFKIILFESAYQVLHRVVRLISLLQKWAPDILSGNSTSCLDIVWNDALEMTICKSGFIIIEQMSWRTIGGKIALLNNPSDFIMTIFLVDTNQDDISPEVVSSKLLKYLITKDFVFSQVIFPLLI